MKTLLLTVIALLASCDLHPNKVILNGSWDVYDSADGSNAGSASILDRMDGTLTMQTGGTYSPFEGEWDGCWDLESTASIRFESCINYDGLLASREWIGTIECGTMSMEFQTWVSLGECFASDRFESNSYYMIHR